MGCLGVLFNLLWIVSGGWMTALGFVSVGLLCYLSIIGIPLGRQAFKMAGLTLTPFGKQVTYGGGAPSLVANVVWILLFGWWAAAFYAVCGLVFCITIVGAPFGVQLFKMAKLALCPFGARVS